MDFKRDLVTGITIRRGAGTNVVLRNYTYNTFGYNSRSELTSEPPRERVNHLQ